MALTVAWLTPICRAIILWESSPERNNCSIRSTMAASIIS
jgi:hypothetical protein